MSKLDAFTFGMTTPAKAGQAAMRVIDALQDIPANEQAAGLTAAFMLMAERYGIRVPDACTTAHNIMTAAEGRRPEFKAVEAYMAEEWK